LKAGGTLLISRPFVASSVARCLGKSIKLPPK
jgi:hypothetical protein